MRNTTRLWYCEYGLWTSHSEKGLVACPDSEERGRFCGEVKPGDFLYTTALKYLYEVEEE